MKNNTNNRNLFLHDIYLMRRNLLGEMRRNRIIGRRSQPSLSLNEPIISLVSNEGKEVITFRQPEWKLSANVA